MTITTNRPEDLMPSDLVTIAENEVVKKILAAMYQERGYVLIVNEGNGGLSIMSNLDSFHDMLMLTGNATNLLASVPPDGGDPIPEGMEPSWPKPN